MKRISFVSALALASLSGSALAEEGSVQPYIDRLKQKNPEAYPAESHSNEEYINSIRSGLPAQETQGADTQQPYIDKLKNKHPERYENKAEESYTEKKKAEVGPNEEPSAIAAVKEGRSDLTMKRPGEIRGAFGLKYSASITRNVTGNSDTVNSNFNALYGGNYVPDLTLFWEYQPMHHETFGSLGIQVGLGFSYYSGYGAFRTQLLKPSGAPFPMQSQTKFTFGAIPVSVGAIYRLNVLNWVRPYAALLPTAVGYFESRNDDRDGHRGYSKAIMTNIGASILLDGISREATWALYRDFGVKHSYVTLEYTRLKSFASSVDFNFYGLSAGLTFEY